MTDILIMNNVELNVHNMRDTENDRIGQNASVKGY
jgi:hypothetical protein